MTTEQIRGTDHMAQAVIDEATTVDWRLQYGDEIDDALREEFARGGHGTVVRDTFPQLGGTCLRCGVSVTAGGVAPSECDERVARVAAIQRLRGEYPNATGVEIDDYLNDLAEIRREMTEAIEEMER